MTPTEQTPLCTPPNTLSLYPPFNNGGRHEVHQPPPYGIVEIAPCNSSTPIPEKPRQPGGIASTPIVALIALGVAFFLLFGVTLITPDEQKVVHSVLLRQSAPGSTPNSGGTGEEYKDITIPQGKLRGFTKKSRQGRDYTAYYKVPYAEPPLGDLRFKDPVSPRGIWQAIRAIKEVAPQCIQKGKYLPTVQAVGDEDCLYSNIYVPVITGSNGPLPVMVYVHGGDFTAGNGSRYGPEYFMDEDVILITFQFRLGAFGFLNTGDDVIRGNMAFKDQVQMLTWTRDNIQYFGGDPQKVTIFGNSGGGMAVSLLMLSPMANGLFHRAISQSGASACLSMNQMLNEDPSKTVEEVGSVLGCDTQDSTAFLECLRTKPAADIALVRTPKAIYSLTLETHGNEAQAFISDNPYTLLKSNPSRVPYILGVVSHEWIGNALTILGSEQMVENLNKNWTGIAEQVLFVKDATPEQLLSVKDFYFGTKEIGNETFRETIDLVSDRFINHCVYATAHLQSEFSPAYLYRLNKPPYLSYVEKNIPGFPAKELGMTSHADELQYFFLYDGYPEIKKDDQEYFEFSKYLVNVWATFARDGAPPQEWQPAMTTEVDSTFWFELSDKPGQTDVMTDRMNLWDQFSHKQLNYDDSS